MAVKMATRSIPDDIFRIARIPGDPFSLPDWTRIHSDGTFGNRFDDPGGRFGIPPENRFRVIYCATQREAAFAEVLSRFRQRPNLNEALAAIEDDEETVEQSYQILDGAFDPEYKDHALIESNWLQRRRIASSRIVPSGEIVDFGHADTLAHLDEVLSRIVQVLGFDTFDLSAATSRERFLTQIASRYIYLERFAGIRYVSRLGGNWECWALFEGRFQHERGYPGFPESIHPDDEDLLSAAKRYGITIEVLRGMNHYLRPWRDQSG